MEYMRKCNVCGKVFCYTDEDLQESAKNAGLGALSALGGLASVLGGGTIFHTHHLQGQANRYEDKVVDYNQCPYCHSRNLSEAQVVDPTQRQAGSFATPSSPAININTAASTESLLKRAFMFLEDGDWLAADAYCEACLDKDPELAEAYLAKLMAELRVKQRKSLSDCAEPFDNLSNYRKILRFAGDDLAAELKGYIAHINARNRQAHLVATYNRAMDAMNAANTEHAFLEAARIFDSICNYKNAADYAQDCRKKAEEARKDAILSEAKSLMGKGLFHHFEAAKSLLETIPGWKDADDALRVCKSKIEELEAKEDAARLEAERKAKRDKKIFKIACPIVCIIIGFIIVLNTVIIPNGRYKDAEAMLAAGNYDEAIAGFEALGSYNDSPERVLEAKYAKAEDCLTSQEFDEAASIFESLGDYKDAAGRRCEVFYHKGENLLVAGNTGGAAIAFAHAGNYKDAATRSAEAWDKCAHRETIVAGRYHTAAVKNDGTVVAVGRNIRDLQMRLDWMENIVAVDVGEDFIIGLRADGTVDASPEDFISFTHRHVNVSFWSGIVSIAAGDDHVVGLCSDGTVVVSGVSDDERSIIRSWTDIVDVVANYSGTVGLRSDGTVVATGVSDDDARAISEWTDIVAIYAGGSIFGLRADGTVVATGHNIWGDLDNVDAWEDIVSVAAACQHSVGLRSDGSIVCSGNSEYYSSRVKDVVAVSAKGWHTVYLFSDGTAVAYGENDDGQTEVDQWTNIRLP